MKSQIFKFVSVRNTQKPSPALQEQLIYLDAIGNASLAKRQLPFTQLLKKIRGDNELSTKEKRERLISESKRYMESDAFIGSLNKFNTLYPNFEKMRYLLHHSEKSSNIERTKDEFKKLFKIEKRDSLLTAEQLNHLSENLFASIILGTNGLVRESISNAIKISHLYSVLQKPNAKENNFNLKTYLKLPLVLPDTIFPLPIEKIEKPKNTTPTRRSVQAEERKALSVQFIRFQRAIAEISAIPQENLTEDGIIGEGNYQKFTPNTKKLLESEGITPRHDKSQALIQLQDKNNSLIFDIVNVTPATEELIVVGSNVIKKDDWESALYELDSAVWNTDMEGYLIAEGDECNLTFPMKIGDLRVVEQEIISYRTGDIAHIENILQGESKERTTRRLKRTEEFISTINEKEEETERDTVTTDRFEIEKEAGKILREQSEAYISGSLQASAGYDSGVNYGSISLGLDAGYSTSTSTEESNKEASNYAKEVVDKARQRVITKIKEERSIRTIEEFEDTNKHTLDNSLGDGHVVGIYRWLNKVYKVTLNNYGKRLLFEFMIPRPALYHLSKIISNNELEVTVSKPIPPSDTNYAIQLFGNDACKSYTLKSHHDVKPENYGIWAAAYGVTTTTPPPANIVISKHIGYSVNAGNTVYETSGVITVDSGYMATKCFIKFSRSGPGGSGWGMFKISTWDEWNNNNLTIQSLDNVEKEIPISLFGWANQTSAHVNILCEPTPKSIEEWKIKTFNAIMSAYDNKLSKYETALAEAKAKQGVIIRGTNPMFNKETIETELMKGCIRMMTHCNPLHSQAIVSVKSECDPNSSIQEFDCCQVNAEKDYIKFVQQAFEWKKMSYLLYPYFWANKCSWDEMYNLDDPDPLMRDFLRAGYARVIIPVTPGYELKACNFLTLGYPDMADLATIPFVDIVDELYTDNPLWSEVIDPDFVVPTSLTILECNSAGVNGTPPIEGMCAASSTMTGNHQTSNTP